MQHVNDLDDVPVPIVYDNFRRSFHVRHSLKLAKMKEQKEGNCQSVISKLLIHSCLCVKEIEKHFDIVSCFHVIHESTQ